MAHTRKHTVGGGKRCKPATKRTTRNSRVKRTMKGGAMEGQTQQPGRLRQFWNKLRGKTQKVGEQAIGGARQAATSRPVLQARLKVGNFMASVRQTYNSSLVGNIGQFKRKFPLHVITMPCGYKAIIVRPEQPILTALREHIGLSDADNLATHIAEFDQNINKREFFIKNMFTEWSNRIASYVYKGDGQIYIIDSSKQLVSNNGNKIDDASKPSSYFQGNMLRIIFYKDATLLNNTSKGCLVQSATQGHDEGPNVSSQAEEIYSEPTVNYGLKGNPIKPKDLSIAGKDGNGGYMALGSQPSQPSSQLSQDAEYLSIVGNGPNQGPNPPAPIGHPPSKTIAHRTSSN